MLLENKQYITYFASYYFALGPDFIYFSFEVEEGGMNPRLWILQIIWYSAAFWAQNPAWVDTEAWSWDVRQDGGAEVRKAVDWAAAEGGKNAR